MLVYVNHFLFEPAQGLDQIMEFVAKWVGQRAKSYVDASRLAEGIRELKLKDGSTLSSRATWSHDKGKTYPFWFCAQLSHRDKKDRLAMGIHAMDRKDRFCQINSVVIFRIVSSLV